MPYVIEIVDGQINLQVTQPVFELQVSSTQGPAGPPGPTGPGATEVHASAVGVGATVVADSVVIADVRGVKWLVWSEDTVSGNMGYVEVSATKDADWTESYFDALVPIGIEVATNAGNLELRITNNHTDIVDYRIIRFQANTVIP